MPKVFSENHLIFGLPLEDVFPEGHLHPRIKELFIQAFDNIINGEYTVTNIIDSLQGSVRNRLDLKENVVNAKNIKNVHVPPGAYLWVIRHFLGLLPLPLLPSYADGKCYNWYDLIQLCRLSLQKSSNHKYTEELLLQISKNIDELPQCNFLLLYNLLNFLRSLSVWPRKEPYVHKNSVISFAEYFGSPVFLREYRPGNVTTIDKKYRLLMVFLIMYWPIIKLRCKGLKNDAVIKFRYRKFFEPCNIFPSYYTSSDKITQTPTYRKLTEDKAPNEHMNKNKKGCCCLYAHEYRIKRDIPYRHDYTVIFKSPKSCCSLSNEKHPKCLWIPANGQVNSSFTFNGDREKLSQSHCTNVQTNDSTSNTTYFGWSPEILVKIKAQKNTSDSKSIITESPDKNSCDGEYIYDDYNDCHYEANSEEVYETVPLKTQSTKLLEAEENSSTSLLDKVAKIGWTYTPPNDTKTQEEEMNPNVSLSKPTQIVSQNVCEGKYNLFFDDISEERQDNREMGTYNESTEILSEPPPELHSSLINLSQSRKSLIKLPRIKSRFGFLRMLTPKASMLQKSTSTSDVSSTIKYRKMN